MGFKQLKKDHRSGRQPRRKPQLASAMLRVVELDKEQGSVTVALAENAAKALKADIADEPAFPLQIRPNPKHAKRQPNMNDLLGLDGGTSNTSMEVEAGTTIMADDVQFNDGAISAGWVMLGTGPASDRNAGGTPADMVDGFVRVRRRTVEDKTKYSAEILFPELAVPTPGGKGLGEAIMGAVDHDRPGEGHAIVRLSDDSGDTLHDVFRRRRNEAGELETVEETGRRAAAAIEEKLKSGGAEGVTVEVIPARTISIGSDAQGQLHAALGSQVGDKMHTGSRKFRVAEVHPSDRRTWPTNLNVDSPVTEGQRGFMDSLAEQRGVDVPAAALSSSAAASAWLDERKTLLGFAPGQLVLRRDMQGEGGETYTIAVASALHRRSGVPLEAVPTPGCPSAPEFARNAAREAQQARAEVMAGNVPEIPRSESPAETGESGTAAPDVQEPEDDSHSPSFD